MVDYYGACDRQGKAVGHSPKAAREYRTLFSEKDEVDLAVSPCIAAEEEDAGGQIPDIEEYTSGFPDQGVRCGLVLPGGFFPDAVYDLCGKRTRKADLSSLPDGRRNRDRRRTDETGIRKRDTEV